MEGIMASVQRKHENEVADLQATVDRLLKVSLFVVSHNTCLVCSSMVNWLCENRMEKGSRA